LAQKSLASVPGATIPCNEDGTPFILTVSPATGLVIRNGATGTLAVSLPCKPSQNVTVVTTVIDGSGMLTVSAGASLTFTTSNWNTPQNVTFQSVAHQAGWQRVISAPVGADIPGFAAVTTHILVS
jgi:cellulose 1,4-beta-cellobiosidase